MRRTNTAMPHLQTSGVTLSDSLTWDPQTGYRKTDKCRWYDEEPALTTSKCEMVRQRQKHRCLIVRLVTAVFKQIRQHLVKRLSWVKNWSDTLECKIYWRLSRVIRLISTAIWVSLQYDHNIFITKYAYVVTSNIHIGHQNILCIQTCLTLAYTHIQQKFISLWV